MHALLRVLGLCKDINQKRSSKIIDGLVQLQRQSNIRMSDHIITGLTKSLTQARYPLIRTQVKPSGGGFVTVPTNGTASLLANVRGRRLLWTARENEPFMKMLNDELKGGESFPILTEVLEAGLGAVPVVGAAASLLFSAISTGVDLAKTSHSVIVRAGDHVWQIEEIGKVGTKVVHVGSYWVVDPYRKQSPEKGWLIHEQRTELTLL